MAKNEEDKEPIRQLELTAIVEEIREQYVPADSMVDCDELLTLGALRIRLGAVPMFGSQQSDPLVSLLDLLQRGTPSFIIRNVPGSGPALLLKYKTHMMTPAEKALQSNEYVDFEDE